MSPHLPSLPQLDLPQSYPSTSLNTRSTDTLSEILPTSCPPITPLAPSGLMEPDGTGLVVALLSHTHTAMHTHYMLTWGLIGEDRDLKEAVFYWLNELTFPGDPPSPLPSYKHTDFSVWFSCLYPEDFFYFFFYTRRRYLFGDPIPVAGIPRLLFALGGMYGPMWTWKIWD